MIRDAWKTFELSGKVTDYLAYRQSKPEETEAAGEGARLERGIGSYGTGCSSVGDGVERNADWGV